ncbi:hypothetical protein D9M71_816260 [compost metagenome]
MSVPVQHRHDQTLRQAGSLSGLDRRYQGIVQPLNRCADIGRQRQRVMQPGNVTHLLNFG